MYLGIFLAGVSIQLLSCVHLTCPTIGMNPISDIIERQFAAERLEQCFCEVGAETVVTEAAAYVGVYPAVEGSGG